MKRKTSAYFGGLVLAITGLLTLIHHTNVPRSRSEPLPNSMHRKQKNWWKAIAEALQIFVALLTVSSFVTAFKFFQAQDYVAAVVHEPIAVTDFEDFASKEPVIAEKILPCVHANIPRTLDGQEYTVKVGTVATVATLMNPPFLLEGNKFVFIYEIGASSPSFVPAYSTVAAQANQEVIPDSENPFTESAMLNDARYNAGYGLYVSTKHFNISLSRALATPARFKQYLQNRYGITMLGEVVLPKRALYVVEDFLPKCIDALDPPHLKRAGYYRLADSRDIWNIVELQNTSGNPIHDATISIDRPGQGITGLVEATVKPDGGEVLHNSAYFAVVRFPTILEHSSKIVVVKTRGRPIDRSSIEISHARTSNPSIPLMLFLAALSLLVAMGYLLLVPDA